MRIQRNQDSPYATVSSCIHYCEIGERLDWVLAWYPLLLEAMYLTSKSLFTIFSQHFKPYSHTKISLFSIQAFDYRVNECTKYSNAINFENQQCLLKKSRTNKITTNYKASLASIRMHSLQDGLCVPDKIIEYQG